MHEFEPRPSLNVETQHALNACAQGTRETGQPGHFKAPRVLVMDDEESILELMARMLEIQGYEVAVTMDGDAAVSKYRAAMEAGNPFDLVILDLTVPTGMGGYETFKAIREFDPGVKAIVSSGYSHEPIILNYKEYGIAGLAPKPYRVADLLKAVAGVLGA